jgi:N-glycosylase/DNA lyase
MDLIKKIKGLKKNKELMKIIISRLNQFSANKDYFSELCFCTLTAGASAGSGIKCQNALNNKFGILSEKQIQKELKKLGYRFHNRAEYIHKNQEKTRLLSKINKMNSRDARQFLAKNFKGIGMKEASHFLRNTGRKDVAIIDRHILRSLGFKADSLTHDKYISIENKLNKLASKTHTNLAELDLMLWFAQTGKVLK